MSEEKNENQDLKTDPAPAVATMTSEQIEARETIVRAIGEKAGALMQLDGAPPDLVASALLWCGVSMYAQGVPGLTREVFLELVGATWDEAKAFLADVEAKAARKVVTP